ncbi:MAG: hypothetical protein WCW14_05115 [Candidatus Paceibacterota bacterium]
MLYIFYGNDTKHSGEASRKLVMGLQKKKPDAEYFKMTEIGFDKNQAEGLVKGQGLFSPNYIVYFDGVLKNAEAKEFVISVLGEMKESSSIFVLREEKIDAPTLKKLEAKAEKVQKCALDEDKLSKDEKLALSGEKISFFEYTDALGGGDKKKIWMLVVDAIKKGVPAEEIHGIFFYQVKTMLLAGKARDMKESGLNPYVYKKARIGAETYGIDKVQKMAGDLVTMYHQAHRGETDFNMALERWVLEL